MALDYAEAFLEAQRLETDPRAGEVRLAYGAAFVRWFARDSGKEGANDRICKYKALVLGPNR
jgi:hypothetical protein